MGTTYGRQKKDKGDQSLIDDVHEGYQDGNQNILSRTLPDIKKANLNGGIAQIARPASRRGAFLFHYVNFKIA